MSLAALFNSSSSEPNTWSTDFCPSVRYYNQELVTTGMLGGINGAANTSGSSTTGPVNAVTGSTAYLDIVPEKPIITSYKAEGSACGMDYSADLKIRLWDDRSYRFLERRRAADPFPVLLDTAAVNFKTAYGEFGLGKKTGVFGASAQAADITPGAGTVDAGQKLQASLSLPLGGLFNATIALTGAEHDVRRPGAMAIAAITTTEGHRTLSARPSLEASLSADLSSVLGGYGDLKATVEVLNGKARSISDSDGGVTITVPDKMSGLGVHVAGKVVGLNVSAGAAATKGLGGIRQSQDTHVSVTAVDGERGYKHKYLGLGYNLNMGGYDMEIKAKKASTLRDQRAVADTNFSKKNSETSFGLSSKCGDDASLNLSYSAVDSLNETRVKVAKAKVISAGICVNF
jgi:hypothetical protein